jgi:hypothetical protein
MLELTRGLWDQGGGHCLAKTSYQITARARQKNLDPAQNRRREGLTSDRFLEEPYAWNSRCEKQIGCALGREHTRLLTALPLSLEREASRNLDLTLAE